MVVRGGLWLAALAGVASGLQLPVRAFDRPCTQPRRPGPGSRTGSERTRLASVRIGSSCPTAIGSRPTRAHKPCPRVGATIGSPLPAVGLDIHLRCWSGGYELPLLVGSAVGGPLHDLRPVAGRGGVDVGGQSVVAAD